MSVRRIFIWVCGVCWEFHRDPNYGGAPGWCFFYGEHEIDHICPDCQSNALEMGVGRVDKEDAKRFILEGSKPVLEAPPSILVED